jgi:hypothetical protein
MTFSLVILYFFIVNVFGCLCGLQRKSQKLLICYVFGGVSSKFSWLGMNMAITLKAFWRLTLLMLLDKHDFQSCNSSFLACKCVWGLWHN